jgi:NAD(P)H-dependent flavin oxidoreductase YrpB (nitropropane dioxygenase family)
MTRSRRNKFIERWAGREWALRQHRDEAIAKLRAAREAGDVDEGPLSMGQDAGLIHDIPSAGELVTRIAQQADEILTQALPRLVRQ